MKISRHYLTINGRTVHYRRCGNGPPLLMVHQSPRSSAEYEALMHEWGAHFTCIAPDTPGFGQSEPLAKSDPDIDDYADAIVEFARALGLERTAAYGFHSGGIILVTALKRHPDFFHGLAVGGYAIWTPQEMAVFGEAYLPPFLPSHYGEHLTWLWNRILEQSWFFPWFDVQPESRLSVAHADPAKVHAVVMEMLDAGDAYRLGYGAVLRAPRDIPPPDAITPPVLITAYDGDPLQAHIDRLGEMPAGWAAHKVSTPADLHEASLAFLRQLPAEDCPALAENSDAGFIQLSTADFDGLIHWRGRKSGVLTVHAPGSELSAGEIAIDMPGHGLSDGWQDEAPVEWSKWQAVIDAASTALSCTSVEYPETEQGDPERLFPDLTPDRFGNYLTVAWSITRARCFFAPWYAANAACAIDFDQNSLAPQALAKGHRALIRATAARTYHQALLQKEGS
jgi:haloalkane dehalogenase